MTETPNYKLVKPDPEDFYNIEEQNANMNKIDEALKSHDEALALKANLDDLPESLALGETETTAYRGDRGKEAYEHTLNGEKHITSDERKAVGKIAGLGSDISEVNTALNNHTSNTTSHLTSSERTTWNAKVAKSTKVTVTLSASSWSSSGQYYYSNSNITSTCVVELLPSSDITAEQFEALAGANIVGGSQDTGYIYLKALGDVPTINVPVQFIIRRDL